MSESVIQKQSNNEKYISVKEALKTQTQLTQSDSPLLDCHLLLGQALGKPRSWLLAHDDYILSTSESASYFSAFQQRKEGIPIAYILGEQEFWSLRFTVNQSTLIPRAETELLIEAILDRFPPDTKKDHSKGRVQVIDLGTGAGPIAISLASERKHFKIVATDRSFDTLCTAQRNSQQVSSNKVVFVQCDWLTAFEDGQFDLIVSNPPYVEADDKHLESLKHEPYNALVADEKGLGDFRKIISSAEQKLRKGGMIILEHGYDQQSAVEGILVEYGFSGIEKLKDLNGQDRVILAYGPDAK
ncbi:MAG: peptide chain release factor N(5)-glutamine methyltransferase [Pseudomonadales bacterium]|nr:peptide chain release factor N(5)-glutamine methyltransferase [Pseudomonadales bacterium]